MSKTKTVRHPGKTIYVDRPSTEDHTHVHLYKEGTDLSAIDKAKAEARAIAAANKKKVMILDISDLDELDF